MLGFCRKDSVITLRFIPAFVNVEQKTEWSAAQ